MKYFDTAYVYGAGASERAANEALVKRYPRGSYLLATKLNAWMMCDGEESAKAQFFTSLERTGAGYFDFYLMHAMRPESDLSNLLADILIWSAKDYNEQPVFAVYNMGGIRADLTKGVVTYGDVLDVAPFENKICFTTLSGEKLMEVFQQIAKRGGEGVSKGVELVIKMDEKGEKGELLSAKLHGQEIDPQAEYRVTTIDYLLEGNDGVPSLRDGKDVVAPRDASNNTRFLIMNYFRDMQAKGMVVDSRVEGRIKVIK
jgi:2',3'-cyclic-nucleotide 2'-phosphodiesterase (5'-nucleotidase family)